jgi:hypothetical protein
MMVLRWRIGENTVIEDPSCDLTGKNDAGCVLFMFFRSNVSVVVPNIKSTLSYY